MMFREIPKAQRPAAEVLGVGEQRPIFVLDHIPDFSGHAGGADRAGVPGDRWPARALRRGRPNGLGELLAAGFDKRVCGREVMSLRQASMSEGRVSSASAAMARSTREGAGSPDSWLDDRSPAVMVIIFVPGLVIGAECRTDILISLTVPQKSPNSRPRTTSALARAASRRSV